MAVAARSVAKDMGVVTIEMKTTFMQPARIDDGPLRGKGRLLTTADGGVNIALVTGATQGLGADIAHELALAGVHKV